VTARRVVKGGSLVAYAIVAETDLRPGAEGLAIAAFELAMTNAQASNLDWSNERSRVNDHDILTIHSSDGVMAIWAEPPYVKLLIAFDAPTLEAVTASFVNS
jgi:hypothetical protein